MSKATFASQPIPKTKYLLDSELVKMMDMCVLGKAYINRKVLLYFLKNPQQIAEQITIIFLKHANPYT